MTNCCDVHPSGGHLRLKGRTGTSLPLTFSLVASHNVGCGEYLSDKRRENR